MRTFPALIPESRRRIPRGRRAFTLLEALLALVILLLAVQMVGQSLLSVVRVSRLAALDRAAAVRVRNLASDAWLGVSPSDFAARHSGAGWTLAAAPLPADLEKTALPWTHWTLTHENGDFLPLDLSFTLRPSAPPTAPTR